MQVMSNNIFQISYQEKEYIRTFFLARSPDAPRTRVKKCEILGAGISDFRRYLPTMIVLSLRSSWRVSIEGIVPDIER